MNYKHALFAFTLALLLQITLAATLEPNDTEFKQVTYQNSEKFYLQNSIEKTDYILGHDKIFYGSGTGKVHVKLYIATKTTPKQLFIGIETAGKQITIDNFRTNRTAQKFTQAKESNKYITPIKFQIDNNLTIVDLNIFFNPSEIGLSEKLDFVLYDETLTEVARADPFLSGYINRFPINFSSDHNGILTDYNMVFDNFTIDTTGHICGGDSNKLAVGWHNGAAITELDLNITGAACGNGNTKIKFRAQFNVPAGQAFTTTDTNGYYVYETENTVASPKRNKANIYSFYDGFEDGTLNKWSAAAEFTINSTVTAEGSKSVYANWASGGGILINNNITSRTRIAQAWVRTNNAACTTANGCLSFDLMHTSGLVARAAIADNQFENFTDGSKIGAGNADTNRWFQFVISYKEGASTWDMNVYDQNEALVTTETGLTANATGNGAALRLATESVDSYFDEVISYYPFYPYDSMTIGAVEDSRLSPDVNVTSPNGSETYDNKTTTSITIEFKISDSDSNSFLVDINYSTSATQGTGTTIINDVNTTGGSITCDDSDFTNSTNCTYTWNIDAVPDGDYKINIDVNDSVKTDYDSSDANFNIFTTPTIGTTGTGNCEMNLNINFYLGEYLQLLASGYDENGTLLENARFDLYKGNTYYFTDKNFIQEEETLTFITNKKINDDEYNFVFKSGNCRETRIIQNNFN